MNRFDWPQYKAWENSKMTERDKVKLEMEVREICKKALRQRLLEEEQSL